ncbi:MAG TPA: 30S ribosomal protein S6 [Candidatus Paceibacterota bacterium]
MDSNKKEGFKVYEVGYLLVSSIPEEKVAGEVETLKSIIGKKGGTFIAEESPKLHSLAYSMKKAVSGVRSTYNEAYFGWLKFELETAALGDIKKALDEHEKVLRYLLIITVRENTTLSQKVASVKPVKNDKEEVVPKKEMSEEEMDKTINELVVE